MVYIRPAYDKVLTQSITTRARDPETSLTVQRNIDEAFRAINGLRILAGASPQAIARALNFQRAQNSVTSRFTLGVQDEQPPQNEPSEPRVIQETETHYMPMKVTGHTNATHYTDTFILPYPWSLEKAHFQFSDGLGTTGLFRVAALLGSAGGVGGSQLNTNTAGTANRGWTDGQKYTYAKNQIKGQESGGGRREIGAGQGFFFRFQIQNVPLLDPLTIGVTITVLADKTVGV